MASNDAQGSSVLAVACIAPESSQNFERWIMKSGFRYSSSFGLRFQPTCGAHWTKPAMLPLVRIGDRVQMETLAVIRSREFESLAYIWSQHVANACTLGIPSASHRLHFRTTPG